MAGTFSLVWAKIFHDLTRYEPETQEWPEDDDEGI